MTRIERNSFIIGLIFLLFSAGIIFCQEQPLIPKDLLELIANEISGEQAFKHVVTLSGWPKNRTEEEYKRTFYEAKYVLEKVKEYGLGKTHIEYFPWKYQNWDPITAELWLIEPERRKLTGLDLVHLCVMQESKSTDITAEVVDVGEGTSSQDYEGKDVSGKIVLCNGNEGFVNTQAVHLRGALGIISYRSFYPDDYPDMVSWGAFLHPLMGSKEKYTFGFMISPRQGHQLKRLIKQHKKVVVKAHIKAQLHPGKLDVVQAVIPGHELPEEEILLMAHLFEYYYKQGANDNKSGSAAILEIARTLNKLIQEGEIPPPRRTIRFFWEPEGFGTFAYLAKYPEVTSKIKAVIDMDMVGESHKKCGAIFRVLGTPDSLPHFSNEVLKHFTEYIASKSGFKQRITTQSFSELIASPSGSKDPFYYDITMSNPRMYNENWLSIPHFLFNCGPDPFYHSSEDRPDKCDPTQLKRAAFLGATAALYLANFNSQEISKMGSLVLAGNAERTAKDTQKALALLSSSDEKNIHKNYKEALNILHQRYKQEERALASIGDYIRVSAGEKARLKKLLPKKNMHSFSVIENYYSYLCGLMKIKEMKPSLSSEERRLSRLVPKRLIGLEYTTDFRYLEKALDDKDIKKKLRIYQTERNIPWEALNFADGKRSILEIRNALSAEFSPANISLKMVEEYLRVLEKAGVVEIRKVQ